MFHLRARPLPFPIHFSFPLLVPLFMVSLFPRLGVIRSRVVVLHLRERIPPFLMNFFSSSFHSPLYVSTLPSVRGYTIARCYFSSARAPPSISHIVLFLSFLFPHICIHSSLSKGLYASVLLPATGIASIIGEFRKSSARLILSA